MIFFISGVVVLCVTAVLYERVEARPAAGRIYNPPISR